LGVRIFNLAKELGMSSKELMAYLETQGHHVKNHMCTIPDPVAQILKDRLPKRNAKLGIRPKAPAAGAPAEAVPSGTPKVGPPAKPAPVPEIPPTARPSIVGKAKPVISTQSTPPRFVASPTPASILTTPVEEVDEEAGEKDKQGKDKAQKTGKDIPPTRKRVFPGSPDFGMDVFGNTRTGVRRVVRRVEPARPGREEEAPSVGGPKSVQISPPITVKDFSAATGIKANEIIGKLMREGQMLTMNSYLPQEILGKLAQDFSIELSYKKKDEDLEAAIQALDTLTPQPEKLMPRAPVVTFMGHVDHGKTSLLDKIRMTKITQGESGGITQHLGSYRVDRGDVHVVFIDTPGHKAFTAMRARGANLTDVAVLVVAADEGPMPQTEEAISHAKAAGVRIVVALNKIDKPTANIPRCKEMLAKLDLIPVEWGGATEYVEVSALTSQGIDNLLTTVSLESQILDLKADPTRPGIGTVLDAHSDAGRGIIATVLVQNGTLRTGDIVLCGTAYGKVRGMWFNGIQAVTEALPSTPVQISGLSEVPDAGDRLYVLPDIGQARQLAEDRLRKKREATRAERDVITLENLFTHLEREEVKELRLVLKADVKGSLEVLKKSVGELSTEAIKVKILHSGVGGISQDDILLADASKAIVVGFHVTADERARAVAEECRIEIRTYEVIYELLDEIRQAMEDRLAPKRREQVKGHLRVQQIYRASKVGNIAGCRVTSGTVARTDKIRLVRDGRVVYTGEISSLKRHKDDVREVREGFECGLKIANYEDIKEGDVIEAYSIVEEKSRL